MHFIHRHLQHYDFILGSSRHDTNILCRFMNFQKRSIFFKKSLMGLSREWQNIQYIGFFPSMFYFKYRRKVLNWGSVLIFDKVLMVRWRINHLKSQKHITEPEIVLKIRQSRRYAVITVTTVFLINFFFQKKRFLCSRGMCEPKFSFLSYFV